MIQLNDQDQLSQEQIDLNNINQGIPQTVFRDPYAEKRALMANVASKGEISVPDALDRIRNQQEETTQLYLRNKEQAEVMKTKALVMTEYVKNRDPNAPVTSSELAAISALRQQDLESPEKLQTAVERNFAAELINRGIATKPASVAAYKEEQDNPALEGVLKAGEERVAKALLAEKQAEKMKVLVEQQGWAGFIGDTAKKFIPGYDWYKKNDLVTQSVMSDILPGDNMIAQIQYLYSLPPEQFDKALAAAVDRLAKDNIPLAKEFANAVVQYSSQDKNLENAFALLDATDITLTAGALGKAVVKGFTKKTIIKNTVKDIAETAANPKSTSADVIAATGDIDTAAIVNAGKAAQLRARGLTKSEEVKEFADLVAPSITRTDSLFAGPSRLATGQAAEVATRLATSGEGVSNVLTRGFGVLRFDNDTAALKSAIDKAIADMGDIHKFDPNNAVLDYRWIPNTQDAVGRSNSVIIEVGTQSKSNFVTPEQADLAAKQIYNFAEGDYNIVQKGGGFHIEVRRDLSETADVVRDALLNVDNTNPESLTNLMLGKVRSAEGLLSKTQNENRKVALGAAETVRQWIEDSFPDIAKYTRDGKKREVLSRLLEQNRKDEAWYNTAAEFENAFYNTTGKYPAPDDYVAYAQAIQISDMDYIVRNSDLYSKKARAGYMQFEVEAPIYNEGAEAATKPYGAAESAAKTYPTKFEGRIVDDLPQKGENHRVMVLSSNGNHKIIDHNEFSPDDLKVIQQGWKDNGYKFIQVFNPMDEGLGKYRSNNDNVPITFIAVRNVRSSRLNPVQIPYKPGGHTTYGDAYYVASPQITPILKKGEFKGESYNGEKILATFRSEKEAKAFQADLDQARQLYDKNDPAFDAFVSSKFAQSPDEIRAMFDLNKGGVGSKEALYVKRDGQTFRDVNPSRYNGLVDYTESKFNPSAEMGVEFASQKSKDVYSFQRGSAQNPIWNKTDAKVLDPLLAMRKNLNDVTSSIAFNDYRTRSVEEWIEQYGDLMVAGGVSKEALRLAPIHYMNRAEDYLTRSAGADRVHLASARQSLKAIQHLISVPSEVKKSTDYIKSRMLNFMFDKNPKVAEWMDEKLMYTTGDPLKFLRSAAFHLKLGLFNPAQLPLQAQAAFNIVALSPKHGLGGVKDYVGLRMLLANPQPQHVATWAKKSGNKDFAEMFEAGRDAGWFSTGGNLSVNQAFAEPTITSGVIGNATTKFLDAGAFFFREGERVNRLVSWSTAWREFKAANPGKAVGDIELRQIMQRADDLTINMTRASNAQIQNGFGSIPTQFWSYQWRLMESVWTGLLGKGALSRGEAARLMAMNGALYGIPVGVMGPMTGLWPWSESIEKYAQENSIDLDTNLLTKTLSRGLFEVINDKVDGKQYAFAERFGPGGLPTLKQIIDGDKKANLDTAIELFLGVGGATAINVLKNVAPVTRQIADVFSGPNKDNPLTSEDILDAFKSVTSINNATKAWVLYQYGTYTTRTGVPIKTGEKEDFIGSFYQLMGMQPREVAKFYARKDVMNDQRAAAQEMTKVIETELSRAFKAANDGNFQQAEIHFRRARAYMEGIGRISVQQRNEIFVNTLRKFKDDDLNELNRRFIMNAPNGDVMKKRIEMIERERATNGR
jgi:hypothetical protein